MYAVAQDFFIILQLYALSLLTYLCLTDCRVKSWICIVPSAHAFHRVIGSIGMEVVCIFMSSESALALSQRVGSCVVHSSMRKFCHYVLLWSSLRSYIVSNDLRKGVV